MGAGAVCSTAVCALGLGLCYTRPGEACAVGTSCVWGVVGAGGSAVLLETEVGENLKEYYRVISTLAGRPGGSRDSNGGKDSVRA